MIVRRTAALAIAATALAVIPATQAVARPAVSGTSGFDRQLLSDVNAARVQRGLDPLAVSDNLTPIAQQWAQHTADVEHSSDNPHLRGDMNAACPSWKLVGENVGVAGESTAQGLFNVYMRNSGERQEMLNPQFTSIAVASVATTEAGAGVEYNVMDFANHCS
jgi:uncharacterized protein YkwD